jgi:hypothetical protein
VSTTIVCGRGGDGGFVFEEWFLLGDVFAWVWFMGVVSGGTRSSEGKSSGLSSVGWSFGMEYDLVSMTFLVSLSPEKENQLTREMLQQFSEPSSPVKGCPQTTTTTGK